MSWRPTRPSTGHCSQLTAEFPCGGIEYGTGLGTLVFASNGGKRAVRLSRSHQVPVMERKSFAISSLMNWVARLSLYSGLRESAATSTFPFPELSFRISRAQDEAFAGGTERSVGRQLRSSKPRSD